MGNFEGSVLWEKNDRVLHGTTDSASDRGSGHLLPIKRYLQQGDGPDGSGHLARKVAAFGRRVCGKVDGYGAFRTFARGKNSFVCHKLAATVQVTCEQGRCPRR